MGQRYNLARIFFTACVMILLTACLPSRMLTPLTTSTCNGGWEPYTSREFPEQSLTWQVGLRETGLEVKDIQVLGWGETWVNLCGSEVTRSWGQAYVEISATILVDDVKDAAALSDTLTHVYPVVKSLVSAEEDLSDARLRLTFTSRQGENESIEVQCDFSQGILLVEQGQGGSDLFISTCQE